MIYIAEYNKTDITSFNGRCASHCVDSGQSTPLLTALAKGWCSNTVDRKMKVLAQPTPPYTGPVTRAQRWLIYESACSSCTNPIGWLNDAPNLCSQSKQGLASDHGPPDTQPLPLPLNGVWGLENSNCEVSILLVSPVSYSFGHLGPHAKFTSFWSIFG